MLYEIYTGKTPFYNSNHKLLLNNIISKQPDFPQDMPKEAVLFISKLLQKNPKKRLGWESNDDIRNHYFFKKIDFDKVLNKSYESIFVNKVAEVKQYEFFDKECLKKDPKTAVKSFELDKSIDSLVQFENFTYTDFENVNDMND